MSARPPQSARSRAGASPTPRAGIEPARSRVGRLAIGSAVAGALAFAGAVVAGCGSDRAPLRFPDANLVVVSVDTLRADHMSLYDYDRPTTPFLEELAEEAIVFEHAVAPTTWTMPSHAALFTSRYPTEMGLRTWPEPGRIPDDVPTLPEMLAAAGFLNHAYTESAWMAGRFGFARGFEVYDDRGGRLRSILPRARAALPKLAEHRSFLFLHTYDVHWYDPLFVALKPFLRPYSGDLHAGLRLRQKLQDGANKEWRERLTPADRRFVTDLYDGSIREVDDALRTFVAALERAGTWDRTVFVLTSDHGEELLDHGRTGHGYTVYDEQIMVPLLIRLPGGARGGTRVTSQVRNIDVVPTVLELLDVDPTEIAGGDLVTFRGRSLVPRIDGPSDDDAPAFVDRGHVNAVGVRTRAWKLVLDRRDGSSRAYDLAADPQENQPIPSSEARERHGEVDRLGRALEAWLSEITDARPAPAVPLDDEEQRRIEALGYGETGKSGR